MSDEKRYGIDQSVTSHNQQGGITAHTVHLYTDPPQRVLDEAAKQNLLSKLPNGSKINVMCIPGNTEAMRLAQQIFSFLQTRGFRMLGLNHWEAARVPVGNIEIVPIGETMEVRIGPAR